MALPLAEAAKCIRKRPWPFRRVQRHHNNSAVPSAALRTDRRRPVRKCEQTGQFWFSGPPPMTSTGFLGAVHCRLKNVNCPVHSADGGDDRGGYPEPSGRTAHNHHNPRFHPPRPEIQNLHSGKPARRTHPAQPFGRRARVAQHLQDRRSSTRTLQRGFDIFTGKTETKHRCAGALINPSGTNIHGPPTII